MSIIRDITGICLEQGLEFKTITKNGIPKATVFYAGVIQFEGDSNHCLIFLKGYAKGNKKGNLADLLERICRGNIEILRGEFGVTVENVRTMINELEAMYLSDDEVNEREMRK